MRDSALATAIPASLDEYRSLHRLAQRRLRNAEASCTWRTVPRKSIRSFHAWAFRGPTGNEPHPAAKDAEIRMCFTLTFSQIQLYLVLRYRVRT